MAKRKQHTMQKLLNTRAIKTLEDKLYYMKALQSVRADEVEETTGLRWDETQQTIELLETCINNI